MKKFKKMIALVIAMVMALAMSVTAFAENTPIATPEGGFSVTVTRDDTDEGTHTYEAYQIFTGDLVQDEDGNKILSNIDWGTGITVDAQFVAAIEALRDNTAEGYKVLTTESPAADFANAIAELNATHDDATAQAIAAAIGDALANPTGTGSDTGVSGLQPGYYLIQDASAPEAPDDEHNSGAKTRYILQVVDSVTIAEKASVPSVVKKVKDTNDSKAATATANADDYDENGQILKDSADYDIGDAVPFQITATTASTVHDYTKYHVTIVDDQSDGLDAPANFSIAVLGQTLTLNNAANASAQATVGKIKVTAAIVAAGADFQIKVTFENTDNAGKEDDFVKLGTAVDSQAIVVSYTSVLNSEAELGVTGNPNEVFLKYSNNPNSSDDNEEGETPKDKVIVFTYKPVINKVDETDEPLEGAGFTLYKEVATGYVAKTGEEVKTGAAIKAELAEQNSSIDANALKDDSNYVAKAMTLVTGSTTSFEFKGIDDGTYVLVETTIPKGYNAFVAEEFEVSATHDEESDDPTLTDLQGGDRLTGDVDAGTLTGKVENKSGSVLPSTGGMGTTLFYIVGAVLVIGAGVLLVTRRRMSAQ